MPLPGAVKGSLQTCPWKQVVAGEGTSSEHQILFFSFLIRTDESSAENCLTDDSRRTPEACIGSSSSFDLLRNMLVIVQSLATLPSLKQTQHQLRDRFSTPLWWLL